MRHSRLEPARPPAGRRNTIREPELRQLAIVRLEETITRLAELIEQAKEEWRSEEKRFQAAEKAFLAWRLAVKAAALLAILLSRDPMNIVEEIRKLPRGKNIVTLHDDELDIHVTTSTASRLARLLAASKRIPPVIQELARKLDSVKDKAYQLHAYFYEGDPGAAGFGDINELEEAFNKVVLQAARETLVAVQALMRQLAGKENRDWLLPA